MRQYISAVDEELYVELVDVEANPLRELPLAGMNERASEETSETAWFHVDDAHKRSSTPNDHETERSSEWIRKSGEVFWKSGIRLTERTVPSDAGSCCSSRSREREVKPLEEWERLVRQYEAQSSDTLQDTIKAAILAHNPQDPEWRKHVGLNATRMQEYDALRIERKAMHQAYRPWGIEDGNDSTPMEVDALTKGKGKGKGTEQGKERGRERGKAKGKDKPKQGTPDQSSVKCFFCKEKWPRPGGLPQVLGLAL